MSMLLRDPLMRELLLNEYERERFMRHQQHHHQLHPMVRQPVRVRIHDEWPVVASFDTALSDLQQVMDSVNEAIGQYQNSAAKDLGPGGMKSQRTESGDLQVAIDVSQYKPEEINVRLCDDNLVVEAKSESSADDSYHKSEFKRWIKLPADAKHEAIKSTITADRKLVVEVPMKKPIAESRSRSIPIEVQKAKPAVEGGDKGNQEKPASASKGQEQAKK